MDMTQVITSLIGTAIGGGAVLGFIQFLISRRDKQKEEAKLNRDETIKKEMRDHLTHVNDQWKIDYCDKNAKAINDLIKEVREGLAAREETGKQRYDEHHMAIEKLSVEHQKEFLELKKAIDKLTENDSKITESLQRISDKQECMADSLVGQAHDRIIFLTDKISLRGAITNKEKATITSMYEPYHKLGGNGEVKEAVEYVRTLPTKTDEEAREMDEALKRKE